MGQRLAAAVEAGIDGAVQAERRPQLPGVGLQGAQLRRIFAHQDGFEGQPHAGGAQTLHAAAGARPGGGRAGDPLDGGGGGAVERHLHEPRRQLPEQPHHPPGQPGAVGEHGDQHPQLLDVTVDEFKILAQERFAAGQEQIQAARGGHLVQEIEPLGSAQFRSGAAAPDRATQVAVHAAQVAPGRQLQASRQRHPRRPGGGAETLQVLLVGRTDRHHELSTLMFAR